MKIKWLLISIILGIVLLNLRAKKEKPPNVISLQKFKTINPSLQSFERDIKFAVEFLLQQEEIIDDVLSDLNESEKAEVLAIVFPEIIRWNEFQDMIEFSANKTLYVNGGSKLSDFSVGVFQMKPSFIEALEMYASLNSQLDEINDIILNQESEQENRKVRIERLNDFEWQLKYARAFWIIANDKFKVLKFRNQVEKNRFIATSYNTGFKKPVNTIHYWEHKKEFPFGSKMNTDCQAFADFSIEFLNNYQIYFNN